MNRIFAIINFKEVNTKHVGDLIGDLPYGENDKIFVFDKTISKTDSSKYVESINHISIPDECNTLCKCKNFVFRYFKENDVGLKYLYIFEDYLKVNRNKFALFLPELEKMMYNLELNVWFNTVMDDCNYVFSKYDPRVKIDIDDEKFKKIYPKMIYWASHANPTFACYDLQNVELDKMLFDEQFEIAMFYIIKYIADRRNDVNDDAWPFMNYYPTIEEEYGSIERLPQEPDTENLSEKLKKEDALFKSMNIDHHPDTVIENVMKFIIARLERFTDDKI